MNDYSFWDFCYTIIFNYVATIGIRLYHVEKATNILFN